LSRENQKLVDLIESLSVRKRVLMTGLVSLLDYWYFLSIFISLDDESQVVKMQTLLRSIIIIYERSKIGKTNVNGRAKRFTISATAKRNCV